MLPNLGSHLVNLRANARMIGILHEATILYFSNRAMISSADQT
jgi:hypothetical protein